MEQRLSSSALGDNILYYLDMHGRVLVDLMKVVQRDHRLDSYKLDNVAEHFIGVRKHDVSPNDIFRLQRGTSADRAVIAAYCVQVTFYLWARERAELAPSDQSKSLTKITGAALAHPENTPTTTRRPGRVRAILVPKPLDPVRHVGHVI